MSPEMQQWLNFPAYQPGCPPIVSAIDIESLTLALHISAWQGKRFGMQQFTRPVGTGGIFVGHERRWLRAAYLLDREHFIVETYEATQETKHSVNPLSCSQVLAYLLDWLYLDPAERAESAEVPVFKAGTDQQSDLYWSQVYGWLLGLPVPWPGRDPGISYEQQKLDILRRRAREGAIVKRVESLESRIKQRLIPSTNPNSDEEVKE